MVELEWATIRLLDCPVVQRLRGIKQLGFSYLTYPSAEHSRFIHSLGMASVISRFLSSIEKRSGEHDESVIDTLRFVGSNEIKPVLVEEIVHAAILHDVGHMPFSHASEKVLEGLEEDFMCGTLTVADIRDQVGSILQKPLTLSEILSILIVLSTRFEKFYGNYVYPAGKASEALLRIACLIGESPQSHAFLALRSSFLLRLSTLTRSIT
jgi:deoxynucleoside triphosphate triphosphohydrolase SAMHD1